MIYTSYFGAVRSKNLPRERLVSISQWPPKGFIGEKFKYLAPTPSIIRDYKAGKLTNEVYVHRYNKEVLEDLDPQLIYEHLDNKILLCYEKSEDFCHRHLIWRWLLENGYDCEEWGYTGSTDKWLVHWP
jgi:hypothetical protein